MSLDAVSYRAPTLDDISALSTLGAQTFTETFGTLYKAEDLESFLQSCFGEEGVRHDFLTPGMEYRVAETKEGMIGYCKIGPVTCHVASLPDDALELRQLYVLRPYQGTGVAATLMAWALDRFHARGTQNVYLSVYTDNPRAQRFYARHGFKVIGEQNFMVGAHSDLDFIMHLAIDL